MTTTTEYPRTVFTSLKLEPSEESAKFNGFYLPKLTTTEIANIDVDVVDAGGMVYDLDKGMVVTYTGASWTSLSTYSGGTTGDGLDDPSIGFVFPTGPRVDVEVAGNITDGFTYYDRTSNEERIRTYINSGWGTVYVMSNSATGAGLSGYTPFVMPSGSSSNVQVGANQVNGFMYYKNDASQNRIRTYINSNWGTVYTMQSNGADGAGLSGYTPFVLPYGTSKAAVEDVFTNNIPGFMYIKGNEDIRVFASSTWNTVYTYLGASTGTGLTGSANSFELPTGPIASVETGGNQVEGFVYYDTTFDLMRGYLGTTWRTFYAHNNSATGTGLVGSSPFALSSGARASVEVAGNQYNSFMYYDSTNNVIRARVNNTWVTVQTA